MPLLEATASAETACVSTAPTFEQEVGRPDGARRSCDPGWWAIMEHNGDRDPNARSTWALSAMWCLWLIVFTSTALIPAREHWWLFNAAVMALVLVTIWMPDQGDTVFPYYSIVILPIVVFKSVFVGGMCWELAGGQLWPSRLEVDRGVALERNLPRISCSELRLGRPLVPRALFFMRKSAWGAPKRPKAASS